MAYTPELTQLNSQVLRRIAWSLNRPMTETMQWVMQSIANNIPKESICVSCKDATKCSTCPFNTEGKPTGRP
ncbi:MAG: hypothetical protein KAV87_53400 [Desulfobacteraceae bacterium]|nr:hypothetical protein [Desulfobacteraceae bacterium]